MKLRDIDLYRKAIDRIARELPKDKAVILVTGACGLIGSCIVDVLSQANCDHGADYTIYALDKNQERLKDRFQGADGVISVAQDVMSPILIENLDYIIHTASYADPYSYAKYPAETISINVLGTKNVLDYCKGKKTRAMLTSTFEVYGQLDCDAFSEDDCGMVNQNQLRSCYPESKRVAELLFKAYHAEYDVDCVVTRLSSVYGPIISVQDNKAHAEFIRSAVYGQDIVMKSKGLQKRTYSYVMDIISGILMVLFHGISGETYNVANDRSVATIAEVANAVAEISGVGIRYVEITENEMNSYSKPQNCILKVEKIKAIGWEGKYSLMDGLRETIEIYSKLCDIQKNGDK